MDVYVNNQKVDFQPPAALSWQEFFELLLKTEVARDHGIVRVIVDGKDGVERMIQQSRQPIPDTVRVIEIHTKDLGTISHDGLLKAESLIESLKGEVVKAAGLFRESQIEEGGKKLIAVMEAIKPLIQFVHSLGTSFSMDFDGIPLTSTQTLRQRVEGFIGSMKEMIDAQERKDFVALADFLEYQMPEDLEGWHQILAVLQREVEKAGKDSH